MASKPDRQRNEIKVYDKSDDGLKGFYGSTMVYTWSFRVSEGMRVSNRFTHLFQLKFVGGDASMPAVTFSGQKYSSGREVFEGGVCAR